MNMTNRLNHAYPQAPWRVQRQWVSIFLLIVLGFAMIATLYLMVTSQAAIVGREIQDLRRAIIDTENTNANLQTELARLTSADEMTKRARELGFRPVKPDEIEYLYVPGYVAPKAARLAGAPELQPSEPSTPSAYTQSLMDWLNDLLQAQSGGSR